VLKVDLHLHTSEDPHDRISHSAADLVDRAAELGYDALAITLHDAQLDNPRLRDRARARGITLIPGVERTIQGRHVLLLNFPSSVAMSVSSIEDLARVKPRPGGLVIAPHPYFPGRCCLRSSLDRHPDLFDAVEWSYFWTRLLDFNARGAAWARAQGKPLVGNSDLHDLRQLGRTYSLVDAPHDAEAICGAIREGRVTLRTTPVPYPELTGVFARMISSDLLPHVNRRPAAARLSTHAGPAVRLSDAP
jgi:predicted metal-dependent phosphoesterase TrpH